MPSPRPHRKSFNIPGHAHELTFNCYRRYPFLKSDRARQWLADAINCARREHDFLVHAYVFMPEHVHLIAFPNQPVYEIATILRAIKQPTARQAVQHIVRYRPEWIERITRKRGPRTERLFWQSGGGYDRNIDQPDTLRAMADYIHGNPVRRKLVPRPTDWEWSSARWYAGIKDGPIPIDVPNL